MNVIHPTRGPAEYVLTVACDDPSHERRVIATLAYWTRPSDQVAVLMGGWLPWLEVEHDDPEQPPCLQTPFGEAARLKRMGVPEYQGAPRPVKGMTFESRWRFECRACHHTVPAGGRKMNLALEALRAHGVSFLNLRDLAYILKQ